eukprot:7386467-Prymnesium_polylepis.3
MYIKIDRRWGGGSSAPLRDIAARKTLSLLCRGWRHGVLPGADLWVCRRQARRTFQEKGQDGVGATRPGQDRPMVHTREQLRAVLPAQRA